LTVGPVPGLSNTNYSHSTVRLSGFSSRSAEEDYLEGNHFVVKYNIITNGKFFIIYAIVDCEATVLCFVDEQFTN
jgi:hypothetical protein